MKAAFFISIAGHCIADAGNIQGTPCPYAFRAE
jgi:hypothetical protein